MASRLAQAFARQLLGTRQSSVGGRPSHGETPRRMHNSPAMPPSERIGSRREGSNHHIGYPLVQRGAAAPGYPCAVTPPSRPGGYRALQRVSPRRQNWRALGRPRINQQCVANHRKVTRVARGCSAATRGRGRRRRVRSGRNQGGSPRLCGGRRRRRCGILRLRGRSSAGERGPKERVIERKQRRVGRQAEGVEGERLGVAHPPGRLPRRLPGLAPARQNQKHPARGRQQTTPHQRPG